MNPPTRILSDLHFGHPTSFVRATEQLAPLLEGADRVIFNGDSVEMRFVEERGPAAVDFARLQQCCLEAAVEAVFVTGNHDAEISEIHHLDLASGAVFVTHGDILFHGLSPWSKEAARLQEAHTQELSALGNPSQLELQLRAAKRAVRAIQHFGPKLRTPVNRAANLLHEAWPPWRPFHILGCWAVTPHRAHALAAAHRPEAKFVIIGHTHFSGIWHRRDRVVINTGAFLPYSRPLAVDLTEAADGSVEVVVRKVASRGGLFRLGREVARFAKQNK
ncbi:MAG: metallophosphoesterase [Verrucomicrobiota bacterium]